MEDRAETALLRALGFRWSDTYGCWRDPDEYVRYDTAEDALDEACARAELAEPGALLLPRVQRGADHAR